MNHEINQIAREIYALEPMRVYDPEIKDFREQTFDELEEGFIELFNKVARYVIADRKRVVEPLISLKEKEAHVTQWHLEMMKAIVETLKRAGITEEHKQ